MQFVGIKPKRTRGTSRIPNGPAPFLFAEQLKSLKICSKTLLFSLCLSLIPFRLKCRSTEKGNQGIRQDLENERRNA